ncbi:MAG: hypothetical protein Q4D87_01395 [Actinomycetaceae bacterium]|nr:hypothetical protein [Actinomycetaceae bacterium]
MTLPAVGSGRVGDADSLANGQSERVNARVGESTLVARCLPLSMQALDAQGLAHVEELLRERVDAGWSPGEIRRVMDQALPDRVGRLAALVAHRLEVNVLPQAAPVRVRRSVEAERLDQRRRASEALAETVDGELDPLWERAWALVRAENPGASAVEMTRLVPSRVEALRGGESA